VVDETDMLTALLALQDNDPSAVAGNEQDTPIDPLASDLVAFFGRAIDELAAQTPMGPMVLGALAPYMAMLGGIVASAPHDALAAATAYMIEKLDALAADMHATFDGRLDVVGDTADTYSEGA